MPFAGRTFLTAVAVLSLSGFATAAELTKEPLTKVRENIEKEKAVLVDVREKQEWNDGHIEGAIFFPLSSVQDGLSKTELAKLPEDKDKILYLHCVIGKRAATVGTALARYGYQVRPIKPGYRDLVAAGFPRAKAE